ncbi:hypothetical protein ACVBEG_27625 [Pseudomonas sp. GG8]
MFGTQGRGGLVCVIEKALALYIRRGCCLLQQRGPFLVANITFSETVRAFFLGFFRLGMHGTAIRCCCA